MASFHLLAISSIYSVYRGLEYVSNDRDIILSGRRATGITDILFQCQSAAASFLVFDIPNLGIGRYKNRKNILPLQYGVWDLSTSMN